MKDRGHKVGKGLLTEDPDQPGDWIGDVPWFGFPVGVVMRRVSNGVLCELYNDHTKAKPNGDTKSTD